MRIFYPTKGIVSVWVGNFESEDHFDSCVDECVEAELGLETEIDRFCEVAFKPSKLPISDLLRGFSGWNGYLQEVTTKAATDAGIQSANAALVCFHLKCEDAPEQWGDLQFLGSFHSENRPFG